VSDRIPQQQLEAYLWGAATLLRGTIDAGDYKQFIFPLLFYKRVCDVFDEETRAALKESGGDAEFAQYPENHRFQVPSDAHWGKVRHTATNVGRAIQEGMRAIETANPNKLYGIFGDAQWTNKDRLSDAMLRDLVEHFSTLELTLANLPEDELGQGYEYLIKKFADDAGHTAAEFYTNRTVVHLMTEMLEPEPGDSIYDPTCGSGGMLLSCITHLRRKGKEWRNVRLYGQERNLMTSSIARMNCFLHGIEDFRIERGDTLSEPKFVQGDRLMQFDVVLANPPYSIKQWDRDAFASDPWGRNLYGTPSQGRADYAFWQHILCSLKPKTGRCAILFPHGVLFRQEEAEMRRKLIEADLIECVLGLGPNLFYNASMEACVVICRTAKPKSQRGRILFINAVNEVTREHAQSFLTTSHIDHIVAAYEKFKNEPGFAKVASLEEVRKNDHNLKIDLYVATPPANNGNAVGTEPPNELPAAVGKWSDARIQVRDALSSLVPDLKKEAHRPDKLKVAALAEIRRHFDRTEWTRVRFGDVVECLKESVDPNSGELDRYVAGDDMDTDDVHIRRWGTVGDGYLGPAFIRRFRKGQVLYGSRRTYLKKVAYAEFEGITANTTLVLEGVEGEFYQPMLPWLMLSRTFTEHSVRESKGSTNPYINFPDIAKFEFNLPPLDQQRCIAEILWAGDEAMEAAITQYNMLARLKRAAFDERTTFGASQFPLCPLGTVATCQYGLSCALSDQGEYPILRMMNYDEELVAASDLKFADMPAKVAAEFTLERGDILFNRTNSADLVGKVGIFKLEGSYLFASYLVRIKTDRAALLPEFLNFFLSSDVGQSAVRVFATPGVSQSNISAGSLKKVLVPIPPLAEQVKVVQELSEIAATKRTAKRHLESQRAVLRGLTNTLLG
jgi:type I restriction enzyme M protein